MTQHDLSKKMNSSGCAATFMIPAHSVVLAMPPRLRAKVMAQQGSRAKGYANVQVSHMQEASSAEVGGCRQTHVEILKRMQTQNELTCLWKSCHALCIPEWSGCHRYSLIQLFEHEASLAGQVNCRSDALAPAILPLQVVLLLAGSL